MQVGNRERARPRRFCPDGPLRAGGKSFETDRREGQPTLVDLLAVAGDRTRLVGKWHLGRDAEPQHGFQDWFALAVDHPIDRLGPARRSCDGRLEWHEGGKVDIITDAAVDFISRAEDRPFLLFVDRVTTHCGWAGHPEPRVDVYRGCTFDDVPRDEDRTFGIRTSRAVTSSTA